MTRTSSLSIVAGLLALGLQAGPVQADQSRSFVSGLGSDLNAPDCTRDHPCRTFQVAHDHTLASGEIAVLDAGSYGAVIINKNISIINDGVGEAGALVSGGGIGITITAGATDAVTLRGLTIKGLVGFGDSTGIRFTSGLALTIENCVIRNMNGPLPAGQGLQFLPSLTSALVISNSTFTDNLNGGIAIFPPAGTGIFVTAVLDQVGLYNNGVTGIALDGIATDAASKVTATITNSAAGNNFGNAYWAISAAGHGQTTILLTNSVAAGNLVGLRADGGGGPLGMIAIGGSTITSNVTNLLTVTGGHVDTWGNNYEVNNATTNPYTGGIPLH
jgi:hypothetical protein